MFISNKERIQIKRDIETLSKIVGDLNAEVVYLGAKVKALEAKKPKVKKPVSEAQKAKQREYMRNYKAKKKLEAQNGNSVSTTSV